MVQRIAGAMFSLSRAAKACLPPCFVRLPNNTMEQLQYHGRRADYRFALIQNLCWWESLSTFVAQQQVVFGEVQGYFREYSDGNLITED